MQMSGSIAALVLGLTVAQIPAPPAKTPEPPSQATVGSSGPSDSATAPYQKLFTPPRAAAEQPHLQAALQELKRRVEPREPKIVCGMIVYPADPQVDPRMIVRPPEPPPTFHIKRIPPPACAE
jgi:hypothetical protein